ncbi:MAG: Molybdopterin oxidoreductase Fe4S4 domain, partial [Actinomycetota bacterium]
MKLRTACPLDCPDTCSLEVTVEGGKIVDVDAAPVDESS